MLTRQLMVPSLFSSGFGGLSGFSDFSNTMPYSNIDQTDTAVNVELAVPGFKENEVNVTLDGNLLKIQAKHKDDFAPVEEKDRQGRVISRTKTWSSSDIYESFRLPSGLNTGGMTKTVQDGVLKLSIPKLAITDRPQQQQQQQQIGQQQLGQQQLQQPQQYMQWPPNVETKDSSDKKHLIYTIPLPGIQKENIRINVENSNLYLTVVEHGTGHSFDSCTTCTPQQQQQQQVGGSLQQGEQWRRERSNLMNKQCNQFNEKSCVIRLPYGTTSDCIDAKFENGQLTLCVDKRHPAGTVSIH